MKRISLLVAVLGSMPALPMIALAAPPSGGEGQRPPRPPREAVDACKNAEQGDECSFEGRQGETVSGTCEGPPDDDDKPLACRPSKAPPRE